MVLSMVIYTDHKVDRRRGPSGGVRHPEHEEHREQLRLHVDSGERPRRSQRQRDRDAMGGYFWTVSSLIVRSRWTRARSCLGTRQRCS